MVVGGDESHLLEKATFEAASRLLASLVNERFVKATIKKDDASDDHCMICIRSLRSDTQASEESITVRTRRTLGCKANDDVISFLLPAEMMQPITVTVGVQHSSRQVMVNPDPDILFEFAYNWFEVGDMSEAKKQITEELRKSVLNQEAFFKLLPAHQPSLDDHQIVWERANIRGHPIHPMCRNLIAEPPLADITPTDVAQLLNPQISLVSVLRTDIKMIGPFENVLLPFFESLGVNPSSIPLDRALLPCLTRQLPAILKHFPSACREPSTTIKLDAQISLRTVSFRPTAAQRFPYHLKFALAVTISSALRTITPWTACIGPEVTALLERLLPSSLLIFREIAAVTGAQEDFAQAKHISVLVREDLEVRAKSNGDCLIPASALAARGVDGGPCHAERVFELDSPNKRREWFRSYTRKLFDAMLPPLFKHGICLEAHGQNTCARFSLATGDLTGFAYRDFGGLKLHVPTLRAQGYDITTSTPGSLVLIDDIQECWDSAWHVIFGDQLMGLLWALRLDGQGGDSERQGSIGWAIVREELQRILHPGHDEGCTAGAQEMGSPAIASPLLPGEEERKKALYDRLTADTAPYRCFLRMKMAGIYRDVSPIR